ncbi:hypothetical protein [Mesorhizobium australafricanum]|uniref:Uncharacterized protein n=1 Tax=Mesorhizobium australafricanum TaxID=3072311 RepID=A0ABU4X1Y3_9HYPH|nr:hypothetical protein [Mesorhizobium sp. VK3E]MDX8441741.1 hypothetical protein [Mesorhizobium sp. VK3E]
MAGFLLLWLWPPEQFPEKCKAVRLGDFAVAFRPEFASKQKDRAVRRFCENGEPPKCMSPRSVQRFWDNDMHQNKRLKRVA